MHVDARELENNTLIQGDICIIGAGAAGISMALEWIDTPFKVILLEGGGFDYDQKVQESYNGKASGQKYFPLVATRLHQFGGTTGIWGGFCSPFDEIDFKERDWVPHSGWPFEKKELDPFYQRSQKYLELPTSEFELEYYVKKNPDIYSIPFNEEKVWNKMWQFSPPTRFGTRYREEIIQARNIHLYTYAKATDLRANENINHIEEIIVQNYAGKSHRVRAKHVILACGAIQNARMLLVSNNQTQSGLGNEHDNVGRYFMEHLEMLSSGELWLSSELPMELYLHSPDAVCRAELAISEKLQNEKKILNGTINLRPLATARLNSSREDWTIDDKGKEASKSIFEKIKYRFSLMNEKSIKNIGSAYLLGTRIEQSPNPNSRVYVNGETDSLGVPLANLNWELSRIDKYSIRKIYEIIGSEIGVLDIGRVKLLEWLRDPDDYTWPESTSGGWHHMGTTRISDDPKSGVVDSNCKVHGINNLFIAGSSCFPTAGSVNPTLTLIALTLRLSDFIKHQFE